MKKRLSLALILVMLLTAAVPMESFAAVKVSKVTMNLTSATLTKGKTFTLKASVSPSKASKKTVKWTTSNKKVATVTSKGVVKGIKAGTATITAKAADGSGKKATCKVTVKAASTIPNVTDKVLKMTAPSAAKYLGLKNRKKEDDTYYFLKNGQAVSEHATHIGCWFLKTKGNWTLNVIDKSLSFYGIKIGMKKSEVKKHMKKNKWVLNSDYGSVVFYDKKLVYDSVAGFTFKNGILTQIEYYVDDDAE